MKWWLLISFGIAAVVFLGGCRADSGQDARPASPELEAFKKESSEALQALKSLVAKQASETERDLNKFLGDVDVQLECAYERLQEAGPTAKQKLNAFQADLARTKESLEQKLAELRAKTSESTGTGVEKTTDEINQQLEQLRHQIDELTDKLDENPPAEAPPAP